MSSRSRGQRRLWRRTAESGRKRAEPAASLLVPSFPPTSSVSTSTCRLRPNSVRLRSRQLFETIRTEGGLLTPDLLQRVAAGDPNLDGLDPASYHLTPGERLNEV